MADVEASPPGITISTAEDGVPVDQLSSVAPVPGEPLPTTLSVPVQSAADEAVDTLSAPSYIVAVRTSTGLTRNSCRCFHLVDRTDGSTLGESVGVGPAPSIAAAPAVLAVVAALAVRRTVRA